jgi:hypothetical protein
LIGCLQQLSNSFFRFILLSSFGLLRWRSCLQSLGLFSTFLTGWTYSLSAWLFARGAQTLCAVSFYSGGIIE